MSLVGRRPHRLLAIASVVAVLGLSLILGARVSHAPASIAIALRSGIALAASAMLWLAFFGLSRRARLVFGIDGVCVGETFVRYSTVVSLKPQADGVVIERSSPLPAIFVGTSDSQTAVRLVSLLISERDRALRAAKEPSEPLPAAGFRENASQAGWRVRVLDAASDEQRQAAIARVAPAELRKLLDETADPSLEDALHAELRGTR